MSSRSKKRTQQTTQYESTSQSTPASSRSPGRNRPPSPTSISRAQEKEELVGLNNRLATYIERVRFLEGENSRLTTIIRSQEETVTRETTGIKAMYEKELSDARRLIDKLTNDKAKLQLEADAARADCRDFESKYAALQKELKTKDSRLLRAESQVGDLQARLSDAVSQRKHWEAEYERLQKEFDEMAKALASAKKQLEKETLERVNLQNRLQSMKEERDFMASVHAKEINESRTRSAIEIDEVDARYSEEFELRLKDEIQAMREENDAVVENARAEAAAYFEKRLAELTASGAAGVEEMDFLRSELRNVRVRLDEVTTENNKLSAQNSSLEARVRDLVNQLRRQQEEHEAAMTRKDSELRGLRVQLEEQLSEYRDLLSIKIQLDNEIATYNRLLESEESRLNISQSSQSAASPFAQRSIRRTVTGRKRKRGDDTADASYLQQSSASSWAQSASASGPIEIYETDTEGKFVKLLNTTDEDVSLAGWKLEHSSGDDETVFKFHRSVNVKGGEYCTVWSSDSETDHNPPHDIKMKGKRFMTSDAMKTTLYNSEGNEQASRDLKKSIQRTSYSISGGRASDVDSGFEVGREALYYRQPLRNWGDDEPRGDKCAIM